MSQLRISVVVVTAVAASGSLSLGGRAQRADLPLVWVLSTGGTISGRGASSTSLTESRSGAFLGEELVRSVPEIEHDANGKVEQILNVGSPDITLVDWIRLGNRINTIFAEY